MILKIMNTKECMNVRSLYITGTSNVKQLTLNTVAVISMQNEDTETFVFDFKGEFEEYKSYDKSRGVLFKSVKYCDINQVLDDIRNFINQRLTTLASERLLSVSAYNERHKDALVNKVFVLYCPALSRLNVKTLEKCVIDSIKVGLNIVLVTDKEIEVNHTNLINSFSTILCGCELPTGESIRLLGATPTEGKYYLKNKLFSNEMFELDEVRYEDVSRLVTDGWLRICREE